MTKEIYLSPLFSAISPLTPHKIFHEIDSIPNNCDLVGIAYFHHDIPVIKQQLRTLQQKTKQLIVYFEEFNDPCVFEILNDPEFCDCKFFYNIVLTNSPVDNKTVISWTCSGHNVYADSWAQDLISQIKFSKSYRKRFDCLLGRARGHRDFIAEFYEQSLFKNDIIFSYYKEDKFKEHGIWSKDIDQYSLPPQVILPVDIYNQSCFSIIAETCAYNNFSFFTEKTAKVIVGRRLFVMFAGKNYLKNFKKLGFKTFDTIIDESYDNIDNHKERWTRAWEQVEYLCQADIESILEKIQPIVSYNFDHFMKTDWWSGIRQELEKT